MNSQEQDQWLSDGICEKCRRAKYCTSKCAPVKRKDDKLSGHNGAGTKRRKQFDKQKGQ